MPYEHCINKTRVSNVDPNSQMIIPVKNEKTISERLESLEHQLLLMFDDVARLEALLLGNTALPLQSNTTEHRTISDEIDDLLTIASEILQKTSRMNNLI